MYQTFKFFTVRAGISLFLYMTLGFLGLYFFHEVALAGINFDDRVLHWVFGAILIFFGFIVYGVFGDYQFQNALCSLRDYDPQGNEVEIVNRYEDLIYFTSSSYFLPRKASRLRGEVIRDYADFLHSMGQDDPEALKVYLKAYLLEPTTSRFRLPLLTALKRTPKLGWEEIDLLLVMFRSSLRPDTALAAHLADILIKKNHFSRKTEPVFLAALEASTVNVRAIVSFVLPRLLKKNRFDEFAIRFYLNALYLEPYEEERLRAKLAGVWCEGHWRAVDPVLHEKCGEVFNSFPQEERERIQQSIKQTSVSEKWKRLKLFSADDLSGLRKLEVRFGLVRTGTKQLISTVHMVFLLFKNGSKKIVLFFLEVLITFSKTSIMVKLSFIMGLSIFVLVTIVYKNLSKFNLGADRIPSAIFSLKDEKSRTTHTSSGGYTLQIAAMTTQKQADQMLARLGKKGLKGVYILKTKRLNGGYWFKIRLGKYTSKREAQEFSDRLINDHVIKNAFIISYLGK